MYPIRTEKKQAIIDTVILGLNTALGRWVTTILREGHSRPTPSPEDDSLLSALHPEPRPSHSIVLLEMNWAYGSADIM
jgi:hypothetical protein